MKRSILVVALPVMLVQAAVSALLIAATATASVAPVLNVPACTAQGVTIYFDGLAGATNYVNTHEGSHLGVCVTPPVVTGPAASLPPLPSRVALCSTTPQKRADGTTGIFQDWLTSDWLLPTSAAHSWPLAAYGPHGLFCPDSFNIVGLTDQHVKVDGTGKTNYTGPATLQNNVYELYK